MQIFQSKRPGTWSWWVTADSSAAGDSPSAPRIFACCITSVFQDLEASTSPSCKRSHRRTAQTRERSPCSTAAFIQDALPGAVCLGPPSAQLAVSLSHGQDRYASNSSLDILLSPWPFLENVKTNTDAQLPLELHKICICEVDMSIRQH